MPRGHSIKKIFHSSAGTSNAGMYHPSNFEKLAMSKPVGKILDSKVGKRMVGVGNVVKKIFTFPDEGKMQREQDRKNRANAPVGAIGGTNKGEYRPK